MIRRYSVKELEKIFSESNKYKCWLDIELLVFKYLNNKNIVHDKALKELKHDLMLLPRNIRKIERITNHDVVAFLSQIEKTTNVEVKRWLHYGLSSSDLVDTANAMMLHDANRILLRKAYDLLLRLKRIAHVYKETYCLNRIVGGKVEGIVTFGYKIALCYEDIKEAVSDLERHRKNIECVSISGSMGICSHVDAGLQDYVAKELDLYSADCSGEGLSRDRYYKYFQILNRLVQAIHNLCLELRLQSRTEVGEISEISYEKQMGSEAMPHRRAGSSLESICGLCRLFNSYYSVAAKNVAIWLERDVSHASVDRVVFLDAISSAVQVLQRFHRYMKNIQVDEIRMTKNIMKQENVLYKKSALKALLKSNDDVDPSSVEYYLNETCEQAVKEGTSLKVALQSSDLADKMSDFEFSSIFEPSKHFPGLDIYYDRIFMEDYQKDQFDSIFYEKSEILNAIETIAVHLNHKFCDSKKTVRLIASREESVIFMSHLLVKLNFPVELKTLDLSKEKRLAREGKKISGGSLDIEKNEVKGRDVIIVDVLFENGLTEGALKKRVKDLKAKNVCVVSLFALESKLEDEELDVFGLLLPIVEGLAGFGLGNSKGEFRNCGFVGRLKANHLS